MEGLLRGVVRLREGQCCSFHLAARTDTGGAGITDLSQVVGAGAATIRRDLKNLDRQGLLVRVHDRAASLDAGNLFGQASVRSARAPR